jgi:hypothetical protein
VTLRLAGRKREKKTERRDRKGGQGVIEEAGYHLDVATFAALTT